MKYLLFKDKNRRTAIKKIEHKKTILKTIASNYKLPVSVRWKAFSKITELPLNGSKTKITNRCVLTGRKNSIRHFRISRLMLKKFVHQGLLPGFKKIIW